MEKPFVSITSTYKTNPVIDIPQSVIVLELLHDSIPGVKILVAMNFFPVGLVPCIAMIYNTKITNLNTDFLSIQKS